jgi:ribosome biogenesis GTPase / thiamine phosphate phosphatase
MSEGLVTRILSGFYDVSNENGMRRCRARGVFRKRGIHILVGDRVTIEEIGLHEGIVTGVLERSSELVRPPVANVNMAVLVFSITEPPFHQYLLDAALVSVAVAGLSPLIVVTKCDLSTPHEVDRTIAPYHTAGYACIPISVLTEIGIEEVRHAIHGRVSVFVGPSGAGKSTLGNRLSPELGLKMGQVSEKLGRGKHTTRHVELFEIDADTYVVDAPGFSQLEIDVDSGDLWRYFPEFLEPSNDCEYRGCRHLEESDCGIKHAVEMSMVAEERYNSYKALYQDVRHREETRY